MRQAMVASALLAAAISGCADPTTGTSVTVGANGGTIQSDDGVTLTIPAGALAEDTTIRITPSENAPANAVGPAFLLEPEGLHFAVPVTVTLPFDPGKIPANMSGVSVLTAPGGSQRFVSLGGTLSDATHVATKTTHFSTYAAGAGSSVTVESGLNYPEGIAALKGVLYWSSGGDAAAALPRGAGVIQTAPGTGGKIKTLTPQQPDPKSVAVLGGNVFWVDGGTASPTGDTGSALLRVPTKGGTVAPLASGLGFALDLAVDPAGAVFVDADAGVVGTVPVAGGAVVPLATGQSKPSAVAIDANYAYFTCRGDGTVRRVARAGGPVTVIASGQSDPRGIAVSKSAVFWAAAGDGKIMSAPLAGGALVTIADGLAKPRNVATDGTNVYWTNEAGASVMKAPVAGGAVTIVASDQHVPLDLALDGSNLYWTNNGSNDYDGSIERAPK